MTNPRGEEGPNKPLQQTGPQYSYSRHYVSRAAPLLNLVVRRSVQPNRGVSCRVPFAVLVELLRLRIVIFARAIEKPQRKEDGGRPSRRSLSRVAGADAGIPPRMVLAAPVPSAVITAEFTKRLMRTLEPNGA